MSDARSALARLKASRARHRGGDDDGNQHDSLDSGRVTSRTSSPNSVARDRNAHPELSGKEWDFSGVDEPAAQKHQPEIGSNSNRPAAQNAFAASASHKQNELYLERMDDGFRALGMRESESTRLPEDDESNSFRATTDGRFSSKYSTAFTIPHKTPRNLEPGGNARVTQRWLTGPADANGAVTTVSDNPLTCVSLAPGGNAVVVGGTDHALYEVYLPQETRGAKVLPPKTRVLRGGRDGRGHREWVTCVTHDATRGGDAVSGGMDGKVCVWSGTTPTDLLGHAGSVSDLVADDGFVVSASYDKTIRLWRVPESYSSRGSKSASRNIASSKTPTAKRGADDCVATLKAHTAPTLLLAVAETRGDRDGTEEQTRIGKHSGYAFDSLASGDRDGAVCRWDVVAQSAVSHRDAHEGHVTSLLWIHGPDGGGGGKDSRLLVSGGQDGMCRVWDDRQPKPVAAVAAHVGVASNGTETGVGAVSEMAQVHGNGRVVTAGADGRATVLDPRSGYRVISMHLLGDFAYSLCVAPDADVAFVGDGSGNVHVLDVDGTENGGLPSVAYALGAHNGATRGLVATGDGFLVCAGDDGKVMTYTYR